MRPLQHAALLIRALPRLITSLSAKNITIIWYTFTTAAVLYIIYACIIIQAYITHLHHWIIAITHKTKKKNKTATYRPVCTDIFSARSWSVLLSFVSSVEDRTAESPHWWPAWQSSWRRSWRTGRRGDSGGRGRRCTYCCQTPDAWVSLCTWHGP